MIRKVKIVIYNQFPFTEPWKYSISGLVKNGHFGGTEKRDFVGLEPFEL